MRILLFAIVPVLAGCTTTPPESKVPASSTTALPHWTYEGAERPERWGDLSKEYALCSAGSRQSPIDIGTSSPEDLPNIAFRYRLSKPAILNNGHTVQVSHEPGNSIDVDGKTYELIQFHFHVPSEHTIHGKRSDAELHLVHRSAMGELAVAGVLINEGAENAAFKPVWESLPKEPGSAQPLGVEVDPEGMLPARRTTYRYDGSLTTPPCTEGIQWLVMTEPIAASEEQLVALENILKENSRPVQPLNQRTIAQDSSP